MVHIGRSRDTKLTRLARLPIFRSCSPSQLTLLGRLAEEVQVPAGTPLQTESAPGQSWFVLEKGSAAVSRAGRPTALFGPGDFWGEAALLSLQPASVTVVALTPVTLFAFDRRSFLGLLSELPMVSMAILKAMAGWEPLYGQDGGQRVGPRVGLDRKRSPRPVPHAG
jgi:CRP-like cAMP-binding protein